MSGSSRSASPVDAKSDVSGSSSPRERSQTKKRPRYEDPDEEIEDGAEVNGNHANSSGNGGAKDEDDEEGGDQDGGQDAQGGHVNGDADGDEGEGEEDEDEEEDDEEYSDDEIAVDGERRKKRRRKNQFSRFLDVEAEVDDEDEEEEEGDEREEDGDFLDGAGDEPIPNDDSAHRRLDRSYLREEGENAEDLVRALQQRHRVRRAARYDAQSDRVPQRMLMPGPDDPSLWKVRVKPGREKGIIASVFRKAYDRGNASKPLQISSIMYRDSLAGLVFVEARQAAAVLDAVMGIVGVFISHAPQLVPLEEMTALLKIRKKEVNFQEGMWVRMKRGKYAGDLALVHDTEQITNGVVTIKFVPRIDLTPVDKQRQVRAVTGRSGGPRPPQRLFVYDDVRKVHRGAVKHSGRNSYTYDNDEFVEGYGFRDVKFNMISTEDVNPTLEEVSKFQGEENSGAIKFDLSAIADANRNLTVSVLFPGDRVEVYEGEQSGLRGTVETVTADVITIKAEGGDIQGQIVEVPSKSVRKSFEVGEHVKVLGGKNRNATGMVVEIKGDVVTIMSDQGEQEIRAFSKDIRKAGDFSGASGAAGITTSGGMYDLHDMVMLDSTTAAVVTKIEGGMLRVLDQNGASRVISPSQVQPRRENKAFSVAEDADGHDMKVGDAMKERAGETRHGEVINIFRALFVFLHNREMSENNGVFVARSSHLIPITPRTTVDLTRMNPAAIAALPNGGASLVPQQAVNPNKHRLINTLVVIVKGTSKGLVGVIKDLVGDEARVELATNNKTLTISLQSLKRKDPRTGATYPLETGGFGGFGARPANGGYDVNAYASGPMGPPSMPMGGATPGMLGGRTPAPGAFGRTPNPYASGAGAGGRTPAPGFAGAGGRTPASGWGSGGKTPGWQGSGGKTPGPGMGTGGRTPAWPASGGKTPNPYAQTPAASAPTPGPSNYASAPTPRAAATPAASTPYGGPIVTAPTPGASNPYAASTPYGAPTPRGAPTPSALLSAGTPAAVGGPTPYGQPPTPYGTTVNGQVVSNVLPFDWCLDFRHLIVEVGKSTRAGTRNPLHFQRGTYDGKRFTYSLTKDEGGEGYADCVSLDEPAVEEKILAEYLRPIPPDAAGQLVIIISGQGQGQQRKTQYENQGQWMLEPEQGDATGMVISTECLCRLLK